MKEARVNVARVFCKCILCFNIKHKITLVYLSRALWAPRETVDDANFLPPSSSCPTAGGCRVHPREGEEGREEVGREPIWPWRMEHSDSRSTGLVTQSCIPGVLSKLGLGWHLGVGRVTGSGLYSWILIFPYDCWSVCDFSIECEMHSSSFRTSP